VISHGKDSFLHEYQQNNGEHVEILETIRKRKSIRDFKPDPVPRELLEEILTLSVRAPSGVNKQPWEFAILSGPVLEKVKQENVAHFHSGQKSHASFGSGIDRVSVYRTRQVNLAIELFRLMGIAREDKEKRTQWTERGFYYFNAPVAIILLTDEALPLQRVLLDVGAVMQTICLTALAYGLGTCIEGQGVMFPEVLREYGDIPKNKQIITAIAIGYPNWSFPANKIETPREPIENITFWRGFD